MCSCDTEGSIKTDGRALHYVFKIPNRRETMKFYKDILGMKVLRHEEFAEGCEPTCNGHYDNRWSKTMVGYGPENDNFVFELTYNYPIKHYNLGNEFIGVTLKNPDVLNRARQHNWPIKNGNCVEAPGGYKFFIEENGEETKNLVDRVTLACSNLDSTIKYWNSLLGLKVYSMDLDKRSVKFGFNEKQTKLEFVEIDEPISRGQAFGRVAFSCPENQQTRIESKVRKAKGKILVPLISLDTPGKTTVRVIILIDPNGLEICFVNDEAFRLLSQYSPEDERILETQMQKEDNFHEATKEREETEAMGQQPDDETSENQMKEKEQLYDAYKQKEEAGKEEEQEEAGKEEEQEEPGKEEEKEKAGTEEEKEEAGKEEEKGEMEQQPNDGERTSEKQIKEQEQLNDADKEGEEKEAAEEQPELKFNNNRSQEIIHDSYGRLRDETSEEVAPTKVKTRHGSIRTELDDEIAKRKISKAETK